MKNARVFKLKPQIVVDGDEVEGTILIDGHSGAMISCNQTAGLLAMCLRDGAAQEDLIASLMSRWAVAEAEATRDVARFLDRLAALDLLDDAA